MNTPRTQPLSAPCPAWAHRLGALHPNDLTSDEQAELQHHLASCTACTAVYAAYQMVDARILSLPAVQPSAQQVAQLEAFITDQTQNDPRWKPITNLRELRPSRKSARLMRLERRVSFLAAVLIVIALAGSAFVLFSSRHTSSTTARTPTTFYAVSTTGIVSAVDAGSGKTIWSTPLHIKASEQFLVSGGEIFLGSSDYYLYALQTSNGNLLWKHSYKDLTTVGTQTVEIAPHPASDGNAIYFGTPKGIYAWRASDGQQIWRYPTPPTCGAQWGICAPEVETVNNGMVYAYLDGLYALTTTDGSKSWNDPEVSSTTLTVAQNHVYVATYGGGTNNTGSLRVLQADTGQLLNTPGLPRVRPYDMITDGERVYLRSGNFSRSEDVYALQSSDNTVLWHKQYDGLAFSGVHDGSLYYTSQTTAESNSNQQPSQLATVTATNGNIFQQKATQVSHFCAVSSTDGSVQWCRQLPDNATPSLAVVSQETLYVTTTRGVEAIRIRDGKVLWTTLENVSLDHIELA